MMPFVREWVASVVQEKQLSPPVLEVGAYDVNGGVRDLLPQPYIGLDVCSGPGVDVVADIISWRSRRRFNTVVCLETLEHIAEPWIAIEKMYALLKPAGLFVGSWPFLFEVHDHPHDYWRVTPAGFAYLLERAQFTEIEVVRIDTHVMATARRAA